MAHVRKQIRDALKTKLTGLTTTGANVETGRIHSFVEEHATLPGLVIFLDEEEVTEPSEETEIGTQERAVFAYVQGYEQAKSGMENTLDLMAEEVEVAFLSGTHRYLGGLVHNADLVTTEIDMVPGASQPLGVVTMRFKIVYFTREGAPGTAL